MGKELYDALIIGAGPAGSYIASKLATWGYKVLVFEQHERVGEAICCTGIVGRECLDTFPFGKEAILREARSAKFFAPSGEFLRLQAEIAADTLHEALSRHDFSAKVFSEYERKWRQKLIRELKVDYWARRLFERLGDKQIERLFHLIQSKHIHQSLLDSADFSFDWHSRLILKGLRYLGPQSIPLMIRPLWRGLSHD